MSKSIVITGATRGLGRALVERFVEGGHRIWGCGRDPRGVASLGRLGDAVVGSEVDVPDRSAVDAWAARILEGNGGPPDIVINNAGVINRNGVLWEVEADDFDRVVDVNIKGVANVIRALVPAMVEAGRGIIVNLSSGWGRSVSREVAPYCATKWAIEGLTRAMAQELPPGMAAIPLNPGIIDTEMLRSCFGEDAGGFPNPEAWSHEAARTILGFGPADNGQPRSVG